MTPPTGTRGPRSRPQALESLAGELDSAFFKALSEPTRIKLLKFLIVHGRSDIDSIAAAFPQDRSVISRHIAMLRDAGVLRCEQEGRHVLCQVDAQVFLRKLETILADVRKALANCCPPT
jgi:DNA-binding transcriptional ArsR family regulator